MLRSGLLVIAALLTIQPGWAKQRATMPSSDGVLCPLSKTRALAGATPAGLKYSLESLEGKIQRVVDSSAYDVKSATQAQDAVYSLASETYHISLALSQERFNIEKQIQNRSNPPSQEDLQRLYEQKRLMENYAEVFGQLNRQLEAASKGSADAWAELVGASHDISRPQTGQNGATARQTFVEGEKVRLAALKKKMRNLRLEYESATRALAKRSTSPRTPEERRNWLEGMKDLSSAKEERTELRDQIVVLHDLKAAFRKEASWDRYDPPGLTALSEHLNLIRSKLVDADQRFSRANANSDRKLCASNIAKVDEAISELEEISAGYRRTGKIDPNRTDGLISRLKELQGPTSEELSLLTQADPYSGIVTLHSDTPPLPAWDQGNTGTCGIYTGLATVEALVFSNLHQPVRLSDDYGLVALQENRVNQFIQNWEAQVKTGYATSDLETRINTATRESAQAHTLVESVNANGILAKSDWNPKVPVLKNWAAYRNRVAEEISQAQQAYEKWEPQTHDAAAQKAKVSQLGKILKKQVAGIADEMFGDVPRERAKKYAERNVGRVTSYSIPVNPKKPASSRVTLRTRYDIPAKGGFTVPSGAETRWNRVHEDVLRSAQEQGWKVSISVFSGDRPARTRRTGMFSGKKATPDFDVDKNPVSHAMSVLSVKYGSDGRVIKMRVKNSWGTDSGRNGIYTIDAAFLEKYAIGMEISKSEKIPFKGQIPDQANPTSSP